ncbi:sensor histidine kinase [Propionibacteriaceae bacterium G1746]|uniref:sensor histidine kinase n=1 Tax=Aestuariimicrobium sp. G57 TaxID=3418485 RepID=UPI003C1A10F0
MADLGVTEVHESRERIVLAREEERRALRRTLHDDVAPTVAGLGLKAQTARALVAQQHLDRQAVDAILSAMVVEAAAAATLLRTLSYDLRPPALDDRGLLAALRDRTDDLRPIRARFETRGDWQAPLPAALEVAIYRIVSSALLNVAHHSGAGWVGICLARDATGVTLRVSDDGIGVADEVRAGVGLTVMRERAAELGGRCVVRRRNGKPGTTVQAWLPLGARP